MVKISKFYDSMVKSSDFYGNMLRFASLGFAVLSRLISPSLGYVCAAYLCLGMGSMLTCYTDYWKPRDITVLGIIHSIIAISALTFGVFLLYTCMFQVLFAPVGHSIRTVTRVMIL